MLRRIPGGLVLLLRVTGWGAGLAGASTDEEVLRRAEEWIREAETSLRPDTAPSIKQGLAEAKGALRSAELGDRLAEPPHGRAVGRYSLSDAAMQGLWAECVAREVIFLTTGKVRSAR